MPTNWSDRAGRTKGADYSHPHPQVNATKLNLCQNHPASPSERGGAALRHARAVRNGSSSATSDAVTASIGAIPSTDRSCPLAA